MVVVANCWTNAVLQALFDSFGHSNVLVNGRLEQGPVILKDGDLIEVNQCCLKLTLHMYDDCVKAASACHLPPFQAAGRHCIQRCPNLLACLALQVLRKHDGPRQFVYYSKSAGQANTARKCLQQEQWPLTGPGPSEMALLASKAPQISPTTTALPGHATRTCLQRPQPASQEQQQQFAVPPPAPPCPPLPWLNSWMQHPEAQSRAQATQSAQLQLQCQAHRLAEAPVAMPPVAPPLPPLPWVQTSYSAATKEHRAWRQQQQQQGMQKQAQVHPAAAPAAPPLPPLPFAKHVRTSSAAANTQSQPPSQQGSAQFALPPVPPLLPLKPKPSKGSIKVKLSSGNVQDVQQQQQQPYSGDASTEAKAPSTSSDVHRLVAQQAAAAALKRQQHMDKPKHSGQLPQTAAAPPTVSEADQLVHTCIPAALYTRLPCILINSVALLIAQVCSPTTNSMQRKARAF